MTDFRSSSEFERINAEDLQQRVEELRELTRERREGVEGAVANMVERGAWDDLCGRSREKCRGIITIEGLEADCPLEQTHNCPYAEQRRRHSQEQYLRHLGFGGEALYPTPQRLHPIIRPQVEEYCTDIGERLNAGDGLFVLGPVGIGKTCVLSMLAMAAHDLRPSTMVEYWTAESLFSALAADRPQGTAMLRTAHLLLIDDLGTEGVTGWQRSNAVARLNLIIDYRWHEKRSTVLTSNLSRSALEGSGEYQRMIDRLQHRGEWLAVGADELSQRGRDEQPQLEV